MHCLNDRLNLTDVFVEVSDAGMTLCFISCWQPGCIMSKDLSVSSWDMTVVVDVFSVNSIVRGLPTENVQIQLF